MSQDKCLTVLNVKKPRRAGQLLSEHPKGETTQSGKGENSTAFRDYKEKKVTGNEEDNFVIQQTSSSRTALDFKTR